MKEASVCAAFFKNTCLYESVTSQWMHKRRKSQREKEGESRREVKENQGEEKVTEQTGKVEQGRKRAKRKRER